MLQTPEFWVAVAFVITVAAIFKPVSRIVLSGLDKRSDRIREQLEEAQKLREEAQKTLAEYQRMQRDAVQEAEQILANAAKEVTALRKRAEEDLKAQLARREQLAMEKIAQAEASAVQQVRDQSVDLAISATAKLLQDQIDGAKSDALVDEAIKELPGKLK